MARHRFGSCTITLSGTAVWYGYGDYFWNWQRLTRTYKRPLLLKRFLGLVNRGLCFGYHPNDITSWSRILITKRRIPHTINVVRISLSLERKMSKRRVPATIIR